MASFSELLDKVGRGLTLSTQEQIQLRQQARNIEDVTNLAKGWVDAGTSTPIFKPPIETIYSHVLAVDAANITVQIPNTFNHLLIFGAGRNKNVGTNSNYFRIQFNGDTGNNYINQFFTAVAAVLTGSRFTAQDHGIVGALSQDGRPAGDVCSFFAFMPHYNNSSLNKNLIHLSTTPFGSFTATESNWDSLDPVSSIKFYSADASNIAAGSILSIYGLL